MSDEIRVKLKPQRPTFVDDSPKDDQTQPEGGQAPVGAIGMSRGWSVSTMDSEVNDQGNQTGVQGENEPISMRQPVQVSLQQQQQLPVQVPSSTQKPQQKPLRTKPEPLGTVDVDGLLTTGINEIASLQELKPTEAMALYKRLADDLEELTAMVEEDPELDVRSIVFGHTSESLILSFNNGSSEEFRELSQEMLSEEDAGSCVGDSEAYAEMDRSDSYPAVAGTNSNSDAYTSVSASVSGGDMDDENDIAMSEGTSDIECSTVGSHKLLDMSYTRGLRRYPILLQEEVSKLEDKRRATKLADQERLRSQSNEELGITFRRKSKLDTNFEDWDTQPLSEDEIRENAGSYHINIEHGLCLEIVRKFYLKQVPKLTLEVYLDRINRFLMPSTSVLLTAGYFLFNAAFNLRPENNKCVLPLQSPQEGPVHITPVVPLDVFRLVLSCLRVSLKLIEDKNFKQDYYCKVTGLQKVEDLFNLETAFLYLLDFNLFINEYVLIRFLYQMRVFDRNLHKLIEDRKNAAAEDRGDDNNDNDDANDGANDDANDEANTTMSTGSQTPTESSN